MISPLAAGGLILDIAGAFALASAFMFKKPRDVYFEAQPYYGPNPALVISVAKQTADAWVGGVLLAVGFFGQFAQSVDWEPRWASMALTLPIAFGLAIGSLAAMRWLLRPWSERRTIQGVLAAQRDIGRQSEWRGGIIWLSRTKGREIREGERPADLAISLMGERRWRQLTEGAELPEDVAAPYQPT